MDTTLLVAALLGGMGVTRVVDTLKEASSWEFHPAIKSLFANTLSGIYAIVVVLGLQLDWGAFIVLWFGTMGVALGYHDWNTLMKISADRAVVDMLRRRGAGG